MAEEKKQRCEIGQFIVGLIKAQGNKVSEECEEALYTAHNIHNEGCVQCRNYMQPVHRDKGLKGRGYGKEKES